MTDIVERLRHHALALKSVSRQTASTRNAAALSDEAADTIERLTASRDGYIKQRNALQEEYDRLRAASPWRSMDSAPKDGKHSIFAIKFGPFVYSIQGTWDARHQKWINAADREGEYLAWMPNILLPNELRPWTDEYKSRASAKERPND